VTQKITTDAFVPLAPPHPRKPSSLQTATDSSADALLPIERPLKVQSTNPCPDEITIPTSRPFLLPPHFATRVRRTSQHNRQCIRPRPAIRLRRRTSTPLRQWRTSKKSRILLKNDDDSSADPYIAITDVEGRFLIAGVLPGRYSMQIAHEGFISRS
jgi:hypothetical protein